MSKWKTAEELLTKSDPILAQVIDNYGPCTLKSQTNYYHNLCESIISQQISTKVAETIIKRFCSLFPEAEADVRLFNQLTDDELRNVGLSKQKVVYLRDLTSKVLDDEVDLQHIDQLSNQEISRQLLQVKGIGPWTVTMFLIFGLNRTDILPVGDLGVKKAMQNLYGFPELPKPEEMMQIAQAWHPYETIATWYLWRSLENKA